MRIVYITNGITGGAGLERVLSIKASALTDDYDCEVLILSINDNINDKFFDFSKEIKFESVVLKPENPVRYLVSYRSQFQDAVDRFRPDVICVCDDAIKAFLLPFLIRTRAAWVYERHCAKSIVIGSKSGAGQLFARAQLGLMDVLGRRFDVFVVLSEGNSAEWPFPTRIIGNPLSFFPSEVAPLAHKRVIAVGRQAYAKGYDLLLPAWADVVQRHPEWRLDIYGKQDPDLRLKALAADLGISDSVGFHDPVEDIEAEFLKASICVLSSRFEGFGMVLTEAMACGVPCVTFDCPHGPADIVDHDETGIVVPPEDTRGLASALSTLIRNPVDRERMGKRARSKSQEYSPDAIVEEWYGLFQSLSS